MLMGMMSTRSVAMTAATASTVFVSSRYSSGHLPYLPYLPQFAHYWPADLLAQFTFRMAAKGQCVSSSMMLGNREYAIDKLSSAHTLDDDGLRVLAVQMFSYFDDEPCHAVAHLVSLQLTH
jgi:hypothetical protein